MRSKKRNGNLPKVSVIIPCHNHRQHLWDCINSVFRQQDVTVDVVVVDDSSDLTSYDVAEMMGRVGDVCYLKASYGNANKARNKGLEYATGDYVMFLDADNYLYDYNVLSDMVKTINRESSDVVYGRFKTWGATDSAPYSYLNTLPFTYQDMRISNCIETTCLIRRSSLRNSPFDENIKRFQDWEFHLNNMRHGMKYTFLDRYVMWYFLDPIQRSYRKRDVWTAGRDYIVKKHKLNKNKADITVWLPTSGRYYCFKQWTDSLLALDYPKKKINLVFIDNSNNQQFVDNLLVPWLKKHKHKYNAAVFVSVFSKNSASDTGYDKQVGVSRVMERAKRNTFTKYVFVLEDDTSCEPDALKKLLRLVKKPRVACAIGVERSRNVKECVGLWDTYKTKDGGIGVINLYPRMKQSGTQHIGTGGFYCNVYRWSWLKNHGFTVRKYNNGDTIAVDISTGIDLSTDGWQMWVDWSVQCTHYSLISTGEIIQLKPFVDYDSRCFGALNLPPLQDLYRNE